MIFNFIPTTLSLQTLASYKSCRYFLRVHRTQEDTDRALVTNLFLYTARTGHVLFQFPILRVTTYMVVTPSGPGVGQEVTGTGEVTALSGRQPSSQTYTRGSLPLAQ